MEAKQTSLIDLLESVPRDAVLAYEHDQFSSSFRTVGRLCREAAAALRANAAALEEAASDETLRLAGVIADKIEDGTRFQAGIFSRRDLADKIRAVVRFARQGVPPAAQWAEPSDDELFRLYAEGVGFEIKHSRSRIIPLLRALLSRYGRHAEDAQTADDALDAARYRWLRDREIPEWLDLWHQNPDRIDAAIDVALAAKEG